MTSEEIKLIEGVRNFIEGDAATLREEMATDATYFLTDHSVIVGKNLFRTGWNRAAAAILIYLDGLMDKKL